MKVLIRTDNGKDDKVLVGSYLYHDLDTGEEVWLNEAIEGAIGVEELNAYGITNNNMYMLISDARDGYVDVMYLFAYSIRMGIFKLDIKYLDRFNNLVKKYGKTLEVFDIEYYKTIRSLRWGSLYSKLKLSYGCDIIVKENSYGYSAFSNNFIVNEIVISKDTTSFDLVQKVVEIISNKLCKFDMTPEINNNFITGNTHILIKIAKENCLISIKEINTVEFINELYR